MAPEKVRRRRLRCPPLVSIVVSFYLIEFFIFCELNVWVRKSRIKMKRSLKVLKRKPWKVHGSWGLMKINRQNILKINEGKFLLEICRGKEQMQQYVQDNGRGLGLAGYVMWKSDIKLVAWVSSDMEIYSESSPVFSYPSQITLYRSLHTRWQSILESTIWEILYSGSPSIMTRVGASCILLEKVLDVVGSSMDTWKTGWTEHIDFGRQRVNDRVLGWVVIS